MKLAIALFQNQVSPRFDCAPALLVVQTEAGAATTKEVLPCMEWEPRQRVQNLGNMGVEALICGAIDRESEEQLIAGGIQVYSWVTSGAEEALACFLKGELESGMVLGPDGRCCERWRFRQGRPGYGENRGRGAKRSAMRGKPGPRGRRAGPGRQARIMKPERR